MRNSFSSQKENDEFIDAAAEREKCQMFECGGGGEVEKSTVKSRLFCILIISE